MIRIGQHFCHFDFARFREPAVENFKEKVALKIDKYRLGVFIATLRAAAPKHSGPWHFQAVISADVRDKVATKGAIVALRVL